MPTIKYDMLDNFKDPGPSAAATIVMVAIFGKGAIGGMVVVGRMIHDFGICVLVR